jgi:hypothetical protein
MALSGFGAAFAAARKKHGGGGGIFEFGGKKYTTDIKGENSGGDAPGGGGGGSSMFGADNLKSAAMDIGTGLATSIAGKAGGKALGDAVAAGMKSKFNPYVMAGAVALGALKSREEKKKQKAIGEANRMKEMAKAESKKGEIYGQMSKSIQNTLGAGSRKRDVKL